MPNTHKTPNKDPTPSIYPTIERVQLKQTTAPLLAGYVTLRKALSTLSLSFFSQWNGDNIGYFTWLLKEWRKIKTKFRDVPSSVYSDLSINLSITFPYLLDVKTGWFYFLFKIVFSKHHIHVGCETRRMWQALKKVGEIIGSENVIIRLGVLPGRIHLIRDIRANALHF